DLVAGIVDIVFVTARAAGHAVGALAAGEKIVAAVAGQRVVADTALEIVGAVVAGDLVPELVARPVDIGRTGQRQVLHEVRKDDLAAGSVHLVGAVVGVLDVRIVAVVDRIGVVAGAADHSVGEGAAVELVGAAVADEHVGELVAGGAEAAGAGEGD